MKDKKQERFSKTFKQGQKIEKNLTAKRFGILKECALGVWFYEGKTETRFGSPAHSCCFRGCLMPNYTKGGYSKSVYSSNKRWKGIWIAQELTRTDWKITIVSEQILDAILMDKNSR